MCESVDFNNRLWSPKTASVENLHNSRDKFGFKSVKVPIPESVVDHHRLEEPRLSSSLDDVIVLVTHQNSGNEEEENKISIDHDSSEDSA